MRGRYYVALAAVVAAVGLAALAHVMLRPQLAWQNAVVHAVMEAVGAMIAIRMAGMLWARRLDPGCERFHALALAFVFIGVLDAAVAVSSDPLAMRMFHVASTASGGVWFALAWLPYWGRPHPERRYTWLWATACAALVVLIVVLLLHLYPTVVRSWWMKYAFISFEHTAALAFVFSAVMFLRAFHRSGDVEHMLFGGLSVLFALAQFSLTGSRTWYDEWWFWHAVRLAAFLLVAVMLWRRRRHMTDELARSLAQREQAERRMRENERLYRLLAENVGDVIWIRDLDLGLRYVSPSVQRVTGFTPEEERDRPIDDLAPPESQEKIATALAEELAHDQDPDAPPDRTRTMEMQMWHKDGTRVWVEMVLSFLRDESGAPTGVLGVTRDISERRGQEKERRALEAELMQAQRMEGIGRLAGGIAHDFNNMLAVVLNYADFLTQSLDEDDERLADVEEIRTAARRGAELTRQLLEFSRKQAVTPEDVDLGEVVDEMHGILRRTIGEDLNLVVDKGEGDLYVHADPGKLQQVLLNLVVNARDAMPTGGDLVVSLAAEELDEEFTRHHVEMEPGRYVSLRVTDEGVGMSEEVASRAFEPFYTTKPKDKGTGLGLSTVYGIVRQAGGTIAIESARGRGTSVHVWLPATAPPAERGRVPSIPPDRLGRGRTVLVVEDEPAVRELIVRILNKHSFDVLQAEGGDSALRASDEHPGRIDVLLTDVIMPGMSGAELAERLSSRRPGTRILYMSGYTDDVIGEHGVLPEHTEFLHKPFNASQLVKRIRDVMSRPTPDAAEDGSP